MLNTPEAIAHLLEHTHTIAVVGMSAKPERPGHYVAQYMQQHGFTVIPVNPGQREILGLRCYAHLGEIDQAVDMVNVFRRPDQVGPVVDEAIAIGARSIWLQQGVINHEAAARAQAAGLDVVMDRCLMLEHRALQGG